MYVKSIELKNFRNYKDLKLDFDPVLNIIKGQNAQGKTNLIEAVFIMGLGRSFRTNKDSEMINFGENFSRAFSVIEDEDNERKIEIIYQKDGKVVYVDGVKLQRTADLLENLYVVIFSPEDLKIVKEGPENRRRFIDRELCQIKPVYYSDLGNYKRILKQRNYLLKEKNKNRALLEVFDESLANYGIRIAEERYRFIEELGKISKSIHKDISGNKEELEISYESKISKGITKENYKKELDKCLENDYFKGFTSFGPHKDDLCMKVNGIDIRTFGSQGQQRTAALSLKLAEIEIIKKETGKNAVLLLDDVLSELDVYRQKYLISCVKDIQVFITTTEIDPEIYESFPSGKTFFVDNARVELYNN